MEIHCTQNSGFGGFCSLSVQSQRQRPCLENGSQCCCVSGLGRFASSIGELRRRAGRSMHALRRATENAFSVRRFIGVCPSGKMQSNLPEWSRKKFFFRVNPSCGRLIALARCRRGGSPRASPRAASSPRDALATPHPGKSKRSRAAAARPACPCTCACACASPCSRAAHAHTHALTPLAFATAKQPSTRVSIQEPKGPDSNREPARPPPLAVHERLSGAVPHIP